MNTVELQILQGELEGRTLTLSRPEGILFGRAADAILRVTDDPFVSRHHFLLEVSPPYLLLSDLGSKNGVFVNGTLYGGREQGGAGVAKGPPAGWSGSGSGSGRSVPPRSVFLADGDEIVVGRNRLVVRFPETSGAPQPPRRKGSGRRSHPFSGIPTAAMGEVSPGTEIGPYQVNRGLGRGWMGVVHEAVDTRSGAVVALKTMVPNTVFTDAMGEAFLEQARLLLGGDHPARCRLIEVWRDGNLFVCVQDLVEGLDLARFAALRGGRVAPEEAAPLMLDVLDGLGAAPLRADGKPVLHRNLKPANILVSGQGRSLRGRVADFGLFPALENAGLSQMILSAVYDSAAVYWPRERITWFGQAWPATEVFTAAAVFYEMLTGFLPRAGLSEMRAACKKTGRVPGLADFLGVIAENRPVPIRERNPDLPERVAEVLDKALAEPVIRRGGDEPEAVLAAARFPDLGSFRAALLEALTAHGLKPWAREGEEGGEGWEAPGEQIDAALLVVDLAGSTQLVNKRGTVVFTSIVNAFHSLLRSHESKAGLRFLKCTGDGFFAIYREVAEGLQAARAILAEAARSDVQVRVAMNWGCITIASDGDFLGREVHKLFRIEGLKDGDRVSGPAIPLPLHGRILVTRAIAGQAPGQFVELGMFRLKGFEEPCEIFLFREA
ncbi:MAG: FHA domain-containing protein [Candidatus Riflebacteria bacterium]|nr:FHA domain-containing protein [Candidatus Riflebacteria bacterium]